MSELDETPRERRIRRLKKALAHLVALALTIAVLLFAARALHRRVLYQPPDGATAGSPLPEGATLLTAAAEDGVPVNALSFTAAPGASKPGRTVVLFHGNAETADDSAGLARILTKRGLALVVAEYRGYGRSKGPKPDEAGLYRDGAAILEALRANGTTSDRVVLWGQSLGAGVAVEMAKRGYGSRLVLVAPFTSTVGLAHRVVPWLPASFVLVDRFDNLAKAPSLSLPTLVVHGDADDIIPYELGEQLAQAVVGARFYKVPNGHHNDLYKNALAVAQLLDHATR